MHHLIQVVSWLKWRRIITFQVYPPERDKNFHLIQCLNKHFKTYPNNIQLWCVINNHNCSCQEQHDTTNVIGINKLFGKQNFIWKLATIGLTPSASEELQIEAKRVRLSMGSHIVTQPVNYGCIGECSGISSRPDLYIIFTVLRAFFEVQQR